MTIRANFTDFINWWFNCDRMTLWRCRVTTSSHFVTNNVMLQRQLQRALRVCCNTRLAISEHRQTDRERERERERERPTQIQRQRNVDGLREWLTDWLRLGCLLIPALCSVTATVTVYYALLHKEALQTTCRLPFSLSVSVCLSVPLRDVVTQ